MLLLLRDCEIVCFSERVAGDGFRTCYPKIWRLPIETISSCRGLRKGRCRSYDPHGRGVLSMPGGKEHPYP